MNVSEILDQVNLLSIGADQETLESRLQNLRYLNLAAADLYRKTARLNKDVWEAELFKDHQYSDKISLKYTPLSVESIFDVSSEAKVELLNKPEFLKATAFSKYARPCCFLKGKELSFNQWGDEHTQGDILVSYIPSFTAFEETSPEDKIPFPVEYHNVLVFGCLNWHQIDIDGFRATTKEAAGITSWKDGVASLQSFLFYKHKSTIKINTRV